MSTSHASRTSPSPRPAVPRLEQKGKEPILLKELPRLNVLEKPTVSPIAVKTSSGPHKEVEVGVSAPGQSRRPHAQEQSKNKVAELLPQPRLAHHLLHTSQTTMRTSPEKDQGAGTAPSSKWQNPKRLRHTKSVNEPNTAAHSTRAKALRVKASNYLT